MLPDPFPERIDTVKLFARNGSINAGLPLSRLPRLTDYLADQSGQVRLNLHFGQDEEGQRLLSGVLDAVVTVPCQRCLQNMQLPLQSALHLLVFETEQELQEISADADGVVMEEDGLDLLALIEDELILSLPLVVLHDNAACNETLNMIRQEHSSAVNDTQQSPFAVLAGLKVRNTHTPD